MTYLKNKTSYNDTSDKRNLRKFKGNVKNNSGKGTYGKEEPKQDQV